MVVARHNLKLELGLVQLVHKPGAPAGIRKVRKCVPLNFQNGYFQKPL